MGCPVSLLLDIQNPSDLETTGWYLLVLCMLMLWAGAILPSLAQAPKPQRCTYEADSHSLPEFLGLLKNLGIK